MQSTSKYFNLKTYIHENIIAIKEYIAQSGGVLAIITGFLYSMSSFNLTLCVLLIIIGIDFITGCMASYYKWVENGKPKVKDGYIFSSKKARDTVKKFVSYSTAVVLSWLVSWVTFKNPEISLLGMPAKTIPEYTVIILIGIEAFSILENFKKMGIDIIGNIQSVAKKGWELYDNIKKGEFKETQ